MPGEQTEERSKHHGENRWIGGVVLIMLGVIFLLQNSGRFYLENWWALFILIPAVASFIRAWHVFADNDNRMTGAVAGPLTGGLILTAITCVFLFNLDWGQFWPVLLILAGLGALAGTLSRQKG